MSEIEIIDKKIIALHQQSLDKQKKLLLLRNYYDTNHEETNQLERTIQSLQESIACLKRAQNTLIHAR